MKLVKKIVTNFEYRSDEKREPLEQVCAAYFPKMESILEQALTSNSPESYPFINSCLKIFHSVTHLSIPRFLIADDFQRMHNWLKLHLMIVADIKAPELELIHDPHEFI